MYRIDSLSGYLFGTCLDLDPQERNRLFALFAKPSERAQGILNGRARPVLTQIGATDPVIIKYYRRGGMVKHLVKSLYFRLGKPRPQQEYEMIAHARALGISSPEPLLWAIRGTLFYEAFLVTRLVENHRSFFDVAHQNPAHCQRIVGRVAAQIDLLIRNRIYHRDLHPGNVLIDENERVFIIDFDRATFTCQHPDKLRIAYLKRWKRVAKKYRLPVILTEQLADEIDRRAVRHPIRHCSSGAGVEG